MKPVCNFQTSLNLVKLVVWNCQLSSIQVNLMNILSFSSCFNPYCPKIVAKKKAYHNLPAHEDLFKMTLFVWPFNFLLSKTDKNKTKQRKQQQINVWHFCSINDSIQSSNQLLLIYFHPSHSGRFPSTGGWKTPNERHLIGATRRASSSGCFCSRSFHRLRTRQIGEGGVRNKMADAGSY